MPVPNPSAPAQRPPRWIGWLLWASVLIWIALGLAIPYGGFLLGPGDLLLYVAGFYSLSVKTSQSATSAPAAGWSYVGAGGALVVALAHAATEPDWYVLWYAGVASLLVLLITHWSGTNRVGRAALVVITLLAFIGPAYSLRQTSLLPSIRAGNVAHVALLLRFGADVNRLEQHDRPLIAAVAANRPDLIELLLQAKADPNGRTSVFMNYGPVLMDAARMADSMPLRLLLRYGANPNLANNGGETALFHAARWGRRFNVEALLADRAHPEIQGQQALDAAQEWDNAAEVVRDKKAIIQMLQKAGGTPPRR